MALSSAEKMRRRRERLAQAGLCVRCGQRKTWRDLTVCKPCNEGAKERVRRSRQ